MAEKISKKEALAYHSEGRPGKIEVIPTKQHSSQRELSLAYSPGVAEPCKQIAKNKDDVYKYTANCVCNASSLEINSFEKVNPGIKPLFFNQ